MLKTTLGVIVGIVLGAGAMALSQRHQNPNASLQSALAPPVDPEISRLEDKVKALEAALGAYGKARKPRVVATDTAAEERQSPVKMKAGDAGTHDVAEMFLEQQRQRSANRNAARLATLTQRLNLSPAQQEEVRALLESSASKRSGPGGLVSVAGGGDATSITFDTLDFTTEPAAPSIEAALEALLDDTQREAYAGLKNEEERNRVEAEANEELARLQRMLTLTDAQKDAAFEAFTYGIISAMASAN